MYFIVKRDSDTGRKFQEIQSRVVECFEAQKSFAIKYGFNSFRPKVWEAYGGISSCVDFDTPPDPKIWANKRGTEYFPKGNTKIGKAIRKEIDALPTVSRHKLNMCVGFDGAPFKVIGCNEGHPDYFGFTVGDDWDFTPPEDCTEVTVTEYSNYFKSK